MRKKATITVQDNQYWLYELRVRDIFDLNYTIGDFNITGIAEHLLNDFINQSKDSLLSKITSCPFGVLSTLSLSEFEENILEQFLKINRLFFKKNKKQEQKTTQAQHNIDSFAHDIFDLYCFLIENGHKEVMDYGYSFLMLAINNHSKYKNQKIADLATAVRMGNHADDKAWRKYMKALGIK